MNATGTMTARVATPVLKASARRIQQLGISVKADIKSVRAYGVTLRLALKRRFVSLFRRMMNMKSSFRSTSHTAQKCDGDSDKFSVLV